MSRVLLNMEDPIGRIENNPYSLMNTFNEALQTAKKLDLLYTEIKILEKKKISLSEYNISLKNIFQKHNNIVLEQEYEKRFLSAINQSNKVIICGRIAQNFFEYIFHIKDSKFLKPFQVNIQDNTSVSVFYTGHPSPKSQGNYWTNESNINKLKKFVT